MPITTFKARMRLVPDSQTFAVCKQDGAAAVWVVLHQKLNSLVTFSAANAALCVALCCRRFRGLCGHVKYVRPLHVERVAEAGAAAAAERGVEKSVKAGKTVSTRSRFLTAEEEDDGIEKLPSDTPREKTDTPEEAVAARNHRNLLPCIGVLQDAEVWARSADWISPQATTPPSARQIVNAEKELLKQVVAAMVRLGRIRDKDKPLVER